jgi:hypothetical protein
VSKRKTFKVKVSKRYVRQCVHQAVLEQIECDPHVTRLIDELVEEAVLAEKDALKELVRVAVAEYAPGSERMKLVITGVQKHLERYPLIDTDPTFAAHVGKAVFEYLQGKL